MNQPGSFLIHASMDIFRESFFFICYYSVTLSLVVLILTRMNETRPVEICVQLRNVLQLIYIVCNVFFNSCLNLITVTNDQTHFGSSGVKNTRVNVTKSDTIIDTSPTPNPAPADLAVTDTSAEGEMSHEKLMYMNVANIR